MNYKIPFFDLNYGQEEEKAIIKTLHSKWISMGPNVKELEEKFAQHLNIRYCMAVSNCTAALHLALKSPGIRKGDEVIVPSLTFVATVNAVRYVGAKPIFADITGYDNFSIDPVEIENKITPRTKAIIIMHFGGFSCEMDRIMNVAKKNNLKVIEDAAHAPDSEYKGNKLGTIGDIGCFSFFSNKNITCAEGGIIVTDNDEYAQKARLLRAHGMTKLSFEKSESYAAKYDVVELGYNYRMDDIRAALILAQLKKLKDDTEKRGKLRKHYLKRLTNINEIIIPYRNFKYRSSNHIMPIVLKNSNNKKRDEVRQLLADAGIQTSIHYPAVHRFSIYEKFKTNLPKTDYVADNEITLPMFNHLSKNDINYIAESLQKVL